MTDDSFPTPGNPVVTRHEVPTRKPERCKPRFINSDGDPITPTLDLIFERSAQDQARLALERPGLFVVSKRDLLDAIKA